MDLRRSGLIPRNSLKAVDSIGTDIPAQFATDRSSVYGLAQAGWQLPQVAGRPRGRWLPDASGGRCDEHGAVLVLEGRDEVAAANLLRAWIERHGVPKALYTDWKNVYVREATESERLKGIAPVSQFGRMCARLGIGIVAANSPQAKGRVERAHGTHQDRLVKKLRLAEVCDYEQANRYVETNYLADHNRRFARAASAAANFHRKRPTKRDLDAILQLEQERVVSLDWVVS